ncbi:MAG: hypothetical protein ABIH67_04535 [Candidatus Uhrbacteria bacterium]
MERLIEIKLTELNPTLRALSDAGGTVDDASWIRQDTNAVLVIKFIHEKRQLANINPFELTVEQQLAALRQQNKLGSWGIDEEVFEHLEQTAPEWPEGRDAYRSFRIRFGEGRDGVIQTFEAHAAAIKRVHVKFWRWELLLSGAHEYQDEEVERLRLLAGNDTHHAVVEWIIIDDLSANRQRQSITAVRNNSSLADEGLVMAWLFPERVQAIDYDKWSAWFCAGYESNIPGLSASWTLVPIVYRYLLVGKVRLHASVQGVGISDCSVPASRE